MFKMIGMLLNVVHGQVQEVNKDNFITKESNGFHNHSILITMAKANFFSQKMT